MNAFCVKRTINCSTGVSAKVSANEPRDSTPQYSNERLTYDTIFAWSQSFENLMRNRAGQRYFAEFLKS
ncbi:hypothetical protein PENTCL1PPCAC_3699, partial [Pristionchus entomophagus]